MTLGFPKHVPVRSPDNIRDIAHFHHPEPRYKYQTRWSLSGLVAFGYDLYECRYQNFLLPPQSKARGGGRWGVWSTCRLAHAFRSVDSVPVALWTKNKTAHKVSTSPLRPEDTPFGPPTKFCMWAKFTNAVNCAKFYLHWLLSCFWAHEVRKSQFALCMGNRSYNIVRTNVLHYDLSLAAKTSIMSATAETSLFAT